jgi:SAM-dependent methyltransferase
MTGEHWRRVYATRSAETVSWYQQDPLLSRTLIERAAPPPASVLDVGGGASPLVDHLVSRGYLVGVLDISPEALDVARRRLGAAGDDVDWFVADVTKFRSPRRWDVWHDRAVFHFLVTAEERLAYRAALDGATAAGSTVIMATFGPEGPDRCSGLPTVRYTPEQLAAELGARYSLQGVDWEMHRTPAAVAQQFVYCRFERRE